MSEAVTEQQRVLEAQLEQAKQALAAARAVQQKAEAVHEALLKRNPTAKSLGNIINELVELSQLPLLDKHSPFTGEALGDAAQANAHYAALVERIQAQVTLYRKRLAQSDQRVTAARDELGKARQQVEALSDQLERIRPQVQTRTVTRIDEDGVERVYMVVFRHESIMPWSSSAKDERRFKNILIRVTLLMLLFGIIIPFIPVPKLEISEAPELPERVAQLVQERVPLPPPPPPPPKLGDDKPAKDSTKKNLPKPQERAPETKVVENVREKAQRSGLLAFSDSFADLMDNQAEEKLGKQARVTSGGESARRTERSLITSSAGASSGGINTAALSRDVAGSGLAGRGTSRVTGVIGDNFSNAQRPLAESRRGSRTDEEIQLVFDKNKGALYAIYQRELRKNPTLKGKIVLKLTISPAGDVVASSVASSDLNHPELERKIAARVRLFKFVAKKVDTITITYPIDFLPA